MAQPTTGTWDETKPAGSRALNLGDDDFRELKTQEREILGQEHYVANTPTFSAKHKFTRAAAAPATELGDGNIWFEVDGGGNPVAVNLYNSVTATWQRFGITALASGFDHNHDGVAGQGGILTGDIHDSWSEYRTVATPVAGPADSLRDFTSLDRKRTVRDDGSVRTYLWSSSLTPSDGGAPTLQQANGVLNATYASNLAWDTVPDMAITIASASAVTYVNFTMTLRNQAGGGPGAGAFLTGEFRLTLNGVEIEGTRRRATVAGSGSVRGSQVAIQHGFAAAAADVVRAEWIHLESEDTLLVVASNRKMTALSWA